MGFAAVIDETEMPAALKESGQYVRVCLDAPHEVQRPKRLVLTGEHVSSIGPLSTDARVSPPTEKLRSRRRRSGRAIDGVTLDEACHAANVSHSEAGAAWDLAKESARLVRSGEKAVELNFGIENAPSRRVRVEFFDLLLVRLSRVDPAALLEVLARWNGRVEGM